MYAFLVTCKNPLTIARDSRDCPRVPGTVPCTCHLLKLHLYSQRVLINTPSCLRHCTQSTVAVTPFPRQASEHTEEWKGTRVLQSPDFGGNHSSEKGLLVTPHTWQKGGTQDAWRKKRCHVHRCQFGSYFFTLTKHTFSCMSEMVTHPIRVKGTHR